MNGKVNSIGAGGDFQRGISLIELIMFIVIVSVALAGILLVMNVTTRGSADPLIHKQSLAIAESLLEEVELMPFTFCDPDDANAVTATSAVLGGTGCATTIEVIGTEGTEGRYTPAVLPATLPFDNVSDYNGFNMATGAIMDITNANTGLNGYSASVAVAAQAFSGIAALDADGTPQVLLITITVTGPDGTPVVVEGIRTRYSPRTTP